MDPLKKKTTNNLRGSSVLTRGGGDVVWYLKHQMAVLPSRSNTHLPATFAMPLICRDFISIPEHWNSPRHVLPIGTLIHFAQWHFHVPACRLISTSFLFGTFEWNSRISPVTKYLRKIRSLLTPRAFLCSFLSEQVRQLEQEGITVSVIKKSDIMTLLSHKWYPAMLETTVQIQRLLHSARWFHYFRLITTPLYMGTG